MLLTRKNDISVCSCLMDLASSFHRPGGSADEGFGVFAVEVEEELSTVSSSVLKAAGR